MKVKFLEEDLQKKQEGDLSQVHHSQQQKLDEIDPVQGQSPADSKSQSHSNRQHNSQIKLSKVKSVPSRSSFKTDDDFRSNSSETRTH